MAEQVYIEDIADHVGETVTIKGWLYAKTGKGKLQFLQVRDGTGIIQCVVFKKEVTPEVFEDARSLTQESSQNIGQLFWVKGSSSPLASLHRCMEVDHRLIHL